MSNVVEEMIIETSLRTKVEIVLMLIQLKEVSLEEVASVRNLPLENVLELAAKDIA